MAVGVRGDTLVFVSGQTARDSKGGVEGVGDVRAQTRRAMEKIEGILRQAGGGLEDIVKVTMFLADLEDLPAAVEARSKLLGDNRPASSAVQVGLPPEVLVEVEVVAALDGRGLDER